MLSGLKVEFIEPELSKKIFISVSLVTLIGATSLADPSKLQSHRMCTLINLFNTLFHSVMMTIGSLSESIYLIPVSNSLLVDVGVKVPSL